MANIVPSRAPALCPRCGGSLSVDVGYEAAVCPYCGARFRVSEGLRALDNGGRQASGGSTRPPRKKKHTFRWLLICAAFFLLGRLVIPSVSLRARAQRRTEADRTLSAPAVTAAPRPSLTPRPTATPRPSAEPKTTAAPHAEGVSPEFKRYMDSYEEFFDEYLEFMNGMDGEEDGFGVLLRYAAMLERYAEVMDSLDAIGEEELSTADEIYYLEVLSRINRKLLEASAED